MSFFGLPFVILFVALLVFLWLIRAFLRLIGEKAAVIASKTLILIASVAFAAYANIFYAVILLSLTLVTYILGLAIDGKNAKKLFLILGIAASLVTLATFKYLNFFMSSFCFLFGEEFSALNIIIPLGLSFYSFSAISYLTDVYRKKISSEKNILNFALYMTFFPKLVSGPLIRPREFLIQVKENRFVSAKGLESGLQIFVFGLFKKLVLADRISMFTVEVFNIPNSFTSGTVLLAVISYSFQIYLDFSGYSDMAIGIAKCLGYELPRNFNLPYLARNLTEFWKRWHITLSAWLMDYLYIPLGGNRKCVVRTYVNLFLTMLIGGLWHGDSFTFIIWGALHGLGLVVHKLYNTYIRKNKPANNRLGKIISVALTFAYVTFVWIFFSAGTTERAFRIIRRIFAFNTDAASQPFFWSFLSISIVIIATAVAVIKKKDIAAKAGKYPVMQSNGFYPIFKLNTVWGLTLFFIFAGLTVILAYTAASPFIYAAF